MSYNTGLAYHWVKVTYVLITVVHFCKNLFILCWTSENIVAKSALRYGSGSISKLQNELAFKQELLRFIIRKAFYVNNLKQCNCKSSTNNFFAEKKFRIMIL
jgi:hypothetical protein